MHQYAAQGAVKHHPALLLSAALAPEEVQNAFPDLRGQGPVKMLLLRHEV